MEDKIIINLEECKMLNETASVSFAEQIKPATFAIANIFELVADGVIFKDILVQSTKEVELVAVSVFVVTFSFTTGEISPLIGRR